MDLSPATLSLDIKALRTLVVLLQEGSVTRAAERLGQPQPGLSLTLRRLREVFGDPLLVREGNRLTLTGRASELLERLPHILQELEGAVRPVSGFDPRHSQARFRLLLGNCFESGFLPTIIARIREQAPGVGVDVASLPSLEQVAQYMTSGQLDIALGNWPTPPPSLRRAPLFESEYVCVVHAGHALHAAQPLTLAHYLQAQHLSLSPVVTPTLNPVDARLAALGLTRNVVASVAEYGHVAQLLARTDLVFTTSRRLAQHLVAQGAPLPLALLEMPPEFGAMQFYSLWHERSHRAPAHRWLRGLILQAANDAAVPGPPAVPLQPAGVA